MTEGEEVSFEVGPVKNRLVEHTTEVHMYSVSEDRLNQIKVATKSGSDELALGTTLLTLGIGAIGTLAITEIASMIWMSFFWVLVVIGIPLGVFFLRRWWHNSKVAPSLIDEIIKVKK